ncbi:TPA: CDP-2,3-bis-(O-geranylgeranyl)-sn-glycerol synthase [Thermoplasmata archaeon]|nr:CDP-2,3-bis-(O-geranylgeranyl)-sn-glycerol synthase [Thermoplasmata archaeon]
MSPVEAALAGLWLMLPALIPNSAAVLVGGGTPMDLGKTWRGMRILGDGKTWRGFVGGAAAGVMFGAFQIALGESADLGDAWSHGGWPSAFVVVLCLGLGSMVGDSMGSFIKRRLGVERGIKAPGLDQYNFVIGAVALVMIFEFGWFDHHFVEGNAIWGLVAVLVVVPLLHRGINIIGYKMGKKNVPW